MQDEDWKCPGCAEGCPRTISTVTPAGKLLDGSSDLGLCKIESIWKEPGECDEESYFSGRWYVLPEETKQGRKVRIWSYD